jgi:hypothetical protein
MKRLTTFLHPWDHPFDDGFQLTQSLMAIGRGEWMGVGLGSSVLEVVVSTRSAHRLHLCRDRRRARAVWCHAVMGLLRSCCGAACMSD